MSPSSPPRLASPATPGRLTSLVVGLFVAAVAVLANLQPSGVLGGELMIDGWEPGHGLPLTWLSTEDDDWSSGFGVDYGPWPFIDRSAPLLKWSLTAAAVDTVFGLLVVFLTTRLLFERQRRDARPFAPPAVRLAPSL